MTDRRNKSYWRRTLGLAVCYVLALQAFLAAYGTTLAVAQARAETGFAICHGAGGSEPATDESGTKLPCVMCAVAAAGGGLAPEAGAVTAAPLVVAGRLALVDAVTLPAATPVRAGLARAPPSFA